MKKAFVVKMTSFQAKKAARFIKIHFIVMLAIIPTLESARISPQFMSGSQSFNSLQPQQQWRGDNLQSTPRFSSLISGSDDSIINPLSFPGMGKLRLLSTLFTGMQNTGLEATIAGEVLQRMIKTSLKEIIVPFKQQLFTRFT